MILLCDEIISDVRHLLRGIQFNQETMAVELIHQVGHGGHYLQEDHTLKHFRQEIWRPKYANRKKPEAWQEGSGRRFADKIRIKTRQILESHQTPKLPLEILKEVRTIAAEAAADLRGQAFQA
jgi:trimethylamine--corrinoid protein Co-methyltransferase